MPPIESDIKDQEIETTSSWVYLNSSRVEPIRRRSLTKASLFLSDSEIEEDEQGIEFESGLINQLNEVEGKDLQEGMIPPENYSLVISELILQGLESVNILPERIVLSIEGGYCFIFKKNNIVIYLEIYNDGEIGLIAEDTARKEILENREVNIKEINPVIKNLLSGE